MVLVVITCLIAARFVLRSRLDARGYIRMNPVLWALDADGDGTISAAEIANAPAALRSIDANNDGVLTEDEVAYVFESKPGIADEMTGLLMSYDRNGDGRLTPDELPERMQGLFARGDKNHDGVLPRPRFANWRFIRRRPASRGRDGATPWLPRSIPTAMV